jgi:hypothetical protein
MGDKKRPSTDSEWLGIEYAKATEWALATLEEMALIKSTSTSRVRRQQSICVKMLDVCFGLAPDPFDATARRGNRSDRLLRQMRDGATAEHVLNKELATLREGRTS